MIDKTTSQCHIDHCSTRCCEHGEHGCVTQHAEGFRTEFSHSLAPISWQHYRALTSYIGYLEGALVGLKYTGHEDVTQLANSAIGRAKHYQQQIEETT